MFYRVDAIKRKARKEAWYGDGSTYNPFRKTTRSSTWSNPQRPQDVEGGESLEREAPLAHARSEPIPESPRSAHIHDESKPEEFEMTRAGSISNGRTSHPNSDKTAVERLPTQITATAEKSGVFSRFHRKGKKEAALDADGNEVEKKRPWYKGKVLNHKPFTVRNQIGATVFNSWINILLVAVPVGIAINYAGVDGKIVFVVNFLAIIPLAAMLSFATEEIALHVGESLGGLLNASFGCVCLLHSHFISDKI
jgi:Ca2+:H+ antiporter